MSFTAFPLDPRQNSRSAGTRRGTSKRVSTSRVILSQRVNTGVHFPTTTLFSVNGFLRNVAEPSRANHGIDIESPVIGFPPGVVVIEILQFREQREPGASLFAFQRSHSSPGDDQRTPSPQ